MNISFRENGRHKGTESFKWVSRQDCVQPVAVWREEQLICRYGYSPSEESRGYGEPGQDFGALAVHPASARFVLCDGVSLSYRGDYGAKVLGEGLFEWLQEAPGREMEPAARLLAEISDKAARGLSSLELPEELPPLVREVLLEKRNKGTSAMFVCGYLSRPVKGRDGELWLLWQGDLRIRIWQDGEEKQLFPADSFRTEERWTSHAASFRQQASETAHKPHLLTLPLSARTSGGILIYTDGLQSLDQAGLPIAGDILQEALSGGPEGRLQDDASLLELSWGDLPEEAVRRKATRKRIRRSK